MYRSVRSGRRVRPSSDRRKLPARSPIESPRPLQARDLFKHVVDDLFVQTDFSKDRLDLWAVQANEVFVPGRDDHAGHIDSAWADDQPLVAFREKARWPVLRSREKEGRESAAF